MSKTPKKVNLKGKEVSGHFMNIFCMFRATILDILIFVFLNWVPVN